MRREHETLHLDLQTSATRLCRSTLAAIWACMHVGTGDGRSPRCTGDAESPFHVRVDATVWQSQWCTDLVRSDVPMVDAVQ